MCVCVCGMCVVCVWYVCGVCVCLCGAVMMYCVMPKSKHIKITVGVDTNGQPYAKAWWICTTAAHDVGGCIHVKISENTIIGLTALYYTCQCLLPQSLRTAITL